MVCFKQKKTTVKVVCGDPARAPRLRDAVGQGTVDPPD